MASSSLNRLSRRVLAEADPRDGGERFISLRVDLVAEDDQELLLAAGGEWDRHERRFTGRRAHEKLVLSVHRGQEPAARWYAEWLRGYVTGRPLVAFRDDKGKPRHWITLHLHGGRGSGKTDLGIDLVPPFVAACPRSIVWAASDREEDDREIREYLAAKLPRSWYDFHESADPPYYQIVNGSKIYLRSAAKPDKFKAGRVDLLIYNEAQKMSERAYTYALPRVQDKGGLAVLLSNPPEDDIPRGRWIERHIRAVDAGKLRDEKLFRLSAEDNPHVHADRLEQLRGHMTDRDFRLMKGELLADPNRIVYEYSEEVHRRPAGFDPRPHDRGGTGRALRNVTREFLARKFRRDHFDALLGVDFDKKPHLAATLKLAFDDPEDPFDEGGEPLIWTIRLFLCEPGSEDELCLMLDDFVLEDGPLFGDRLAIVADATAEYQQIERKVSRVTGRGSWDILKRHGYKWIFEPHPGMRQKNPHIADRVGVGNARLRDGHGRVHEYLDVDHNLDPLSEALLGYEKVQGTFNRRSKYAHRFDAWSYPTYRLYPPTWKMKATVGYESLGERSRAGLGLDIFSQKDDDDDE